MYKLWNFKTRFLLAKCHKPAWLLGEIRFPNFILDTSDFLAI